VLTPLITLLVAATGTSADIASKQVPIGVLKSARAKYELSEGNSAAGISKAYGGAKGKAAVQSGVPGVDSLPNWTGSFTAPGFDSRGNPQSVWPFEMVGRPPERGDVTVINTPIIPVVVDLLGPDGKVAVVNGKPLTLDPSQFIRPVVQSPEFEPFPYATGGFTQFNDAMFRTEFADRIRTRHGDDNGWHTLLFPRVKKQQRMQIPFGAWLFGVNPDGSIAFALIDESAFVAALFPSTVPVDNTTVIGAAELAGDMTTRDLTALIFNNVYLFQGTPNNCCVLGFHTYDFEPGDPSNGNRERRFVFSYASWITPGFFAFGFEDITALSHEISETFNDPFVDNATPWWLSVDPILGGGLCQNNLETGDVIEVLSSLPVFPIQSHGMTYHPQNEAMFSWFAFQSPSTAANGSYSFPDETTLTTLSPGPLKPGCVPAN
jgi:hypothetical protein